MAAIEFSLAGVFMQGAVTFHADPHCQGFTFQTTVVCAPTFLLVLWCQSESEPRLLGHC